ncbi:MAG: phosphoribosylanthranilate isomerase [Candidatus Melainabacteria bacterium]|nr:phosphoribosylanthranilate isomerase [Candidatus Melainabacteria bacterium]
MSRPPRTGIKICGITSPCDAARCIEAGADYLGIIFVPETPRYVEISTAISILDAVSKAVPVVGVFQNQPLEVILSVLEKLSLSYVQLHGDEPLEMLEKLPVPVIKVRTIDQAPAQTLATLPLLAHNGPKAWLLDLPKGSSHSHNPWDTPPEPGFLSKIPCGEWWMAGQLSPENIQARVERWQPWVVDVASGVEAAPGEKDPRKVQAFCQAVQQARSQSVFLSQ